MDTSEFTAKFDFERFKNGETALSGSGLECLFVKQIMMQDAYLVQDVGAYITRAVSGLELVKTFRMKPAVSAESPWIPVLDGKCPKEIEAVKAGEWEWKFRSGGVIKARNAPLIDSMFWEHNDGVSDVVAVRLIKQSKELMDGIKAASEKSVELAKHLIENQTKNIRKIHEQQANEAYERFRSSPRGKEALAQIGRAAGPQFKPLGEDVMLHIFSAALTEFESEIERKRK